jgi:glycosyltransferase involved in cell wall biosynthesis
MKPFPSVTLVGHPLAPIGMGENIRCAHRAWRAVHVPARLLDVYQMHKSDKDLGAEFVPHITDRLSADVQIFHINGDEIAPATSHIEARTDRRGLRIVCPAWELTRYPDVWARQLEKFDEVWAQSRFTYETLSKAVKVPVIHMPESSEVHLTSFLGRRYFAIPERNFVFLFSFHFSSYIERKNPLAALRALEHFLAKRPDAVVTFVLKLSGTAAQPEAMAEFEERLKALGDHVLVIDRELSDNEIKNLMRCCDAFISLHRAEGYGHGLSEAMALGKPVIATGYSGNMDFTTDDNTLLVDYRLIPVPENAYPHWEDQQWADPDVEHAARHMVRLYDDPEFARAIGHRASLDQRREFGYRATGVRYRSRLEALWR